MIGILRNRINSRFNCAVLAIVCVFVLSPYIVMILSCFSTDASIKGGLIFSNLSFDNLVTNTSNLFSNPQFSRSFLNSVVVSTLAALISVLLSSMAGYAFGIYNGKQGNSAVMAILLLMMVPTISLVIPTFLISKSIGLLDTYTIMIFTALSLPFLIYLFRQNIVSFPKELLYSARIDGASDLEIFAKVFVPLMKPTFIAALIISFFNSWNSILLPVVLVQSPEKFTNAMYLNSLGAFWNADYGMMMVALCLSTIPLIIIFLIFNRNIRSMFAV